MSNAEIAELLRDVAASYSIQNEQKFRFQIIAYQRAADALESSTTEIKDLIKDNTLEDLPGVGPSIRAHLEELVKTGKSRHFESVMGEIPASVFVLLHIPSFGPKKSYRLVTEFNLNNPKTVIDELEKIALAGKIASLDGFGEKSQADIIRAITEFRKGTGKTTRMPLPYASDLADKIIAYLKKSKFVHEAFTLGSLRRMKSTVGDLDIAVATNNPKEAIDHFVAYPYTDRIIERGESGASLIVSGGKQVDLLAQPINRFGSLLQHFTGSKNHNVHLREYALKKGYSLSERGIKKESRDAKEILEFKTEESFYNFLGMDWIPPEIREDTGEIELAINHDLPNLVTLKDIKGDLHIHSNFPIEPSHDMGNSSMETMLQKAQELGYEYLGFSEHNPSQSKHTNKQVYEILAKRKEKIEHILSSKHSVRVINLLETDILPNGSLAIDEKAMEYLDATLVSVHSSFSMNEKDMTKRVLEGLSHPKAKILSHPTGKLLNSRTGYTLDWEKIFDFCVKNNKALEINSWPERLDLPDTLVREGLKYNMKYVIDTDSHDVSHMNLMKYGVSVARRGWATKNDIINALPFKKFESWLKE